MRIDNSTLYTQVLFICFKYKEGKEDRRKGEVHGGRKEWRAEGTSYFCG